MLKKIKVNVMDSNCETDENWQQQLSLLKKADLLHLFVDTVKSHPELVDSLKTNLAPFPLLKLQGNIILCHTTNSVTDELIRYILAFLSPEQVITVSAVCRSLHQLSNDNYLWSQLICTKFNLDYNSLLFKSISFKKYYKEHKLRHNQGTLFSVGIFAQFP